MSLTVSEFSKCFSHCHCLPQFLVFKYFQRIKCVIAVQVIPASEEMKENYCHDTEKMLCAYCFCSKSEVSFCNHKLLNQSQTYAE